ncbi:MAG: O-antigen ligase family protein [Thermoguttaceae bacterium]|jgi:O-antigen ligase
MIWLLVGYMWLFIHRPFEVWPWLGALHVERVYMLAIIAYWLFCAPKTWTNNRITWGIGSLACAIILATHSSRYTDFDNLAVQDWFKILLFYVLVLASIRDEREFRILIVAFVAITGLYELHSLREYLCGRGVSRMGIWRMVGVDKSLGDPNSFAASVNYALPMLLPVLALSQKKWQRLALAGAAALSCVCVLLTGSRTGFAGIVVLAAAGALATKHRWRFVLLTLLGAPLIWLSLSERLQNRYTTLIDPSLGPASAQESAESRIVFFRMAVDIWREHPLFGVGPACFSIASGTGMQAHSLYGQTMSELGTVGLAALGAMILCYLWNYLEARRVCRNIPSSCESLFCYQVVMATGIALLQLLFFGLSGHNLFRYHWLWYAAFAVLALRFLKARDDAASGICDEGFADAQDDASLAACLPEVP